MSKAAPEFLRASGPTFDFNRSPRGMVSGKRKKADSGDWKRGSDEAQFNQNGLNLAWFYCDEPGDDHAIKGKLPLLARHVMSLRDDGFPECCGQVMRMLSLNEELHEPYAAEILARSERGIEAAKYYRKHGRQIPDGLGDDPAGEFADNAP